MPSFSDFDSLFNYIGKNIKQPLQQIAQEIEQEMKDYIMREKYNWTTEDYVRTYDYINSITISPILNSRHGVDVEIYFDSNKITPSNAPQGSTWNRHKDIYGNSVNEQIPFWIEEGNGDSPYYQYEGIHVIKNTVEDLERNGVHINKLIQLLNSKGFKCRLM